MSIKQSKAVLNAVSQVLGDDFQPGARVLDYITSEQRDEVVELVAEGLQNGSVFFSERAQSVYDTPEKVRKYTKGMVKNWLDKNPELNGGEKHQIKNPGSRTGNKDPQIKAMRTLLSQLEKEGDLEAARAVKAEIDTRVAAIQASRGKTTEIAVDVDSLPENVRKFAKTA